MALTLFHGRGPGDLFRAMRDGVSLTPIPQGLRAAIWDFLSDVGFSGITQASLVEKTWGPWPEPLRDRGAALKWTPQLLQTNATPLDGSGYATLLEVPVPAGTFAPNTGTNMTLRVLLTATQRGGTTRMASMGFGGGVWNEGSGPGLAALHGSATSFWMNEQFVAGVYDAKIEPALSTIDGVTQVAAIKVKYLPGPVPGLQPIGWSAIVEGVAFDGAESGAS